jgi:SH3-like domain-containing protein
LNKFLKYLSFSNHCVSYKICAAITITLIIFAQPSFAKEVPYYASIKADEANVRTGPSSRYQIQWTYRRQNWPIKVTATFERWRKISDISGEIGWIHETLLSKSRYGVIKSKNTQDVYRLPLLSSAKVFKVENGVTIKFKECKNNWCKIRTNGYEGWLQTENIWGIDNNEIIK